MKRRWVLLSAYLLTYIAVAALITWLVRYVTGPAFLLSEVAISGHEDTVTDTHIFRQQNLLFLDTRLLKKQLELEPLVKSADIKKEFPDKLLITLTERSPVLKLESSDTTYLLDRDGVTLPQLPRFTSLNLPMVECSLLTVIGGEGREIRDLLPLIAIINEINRQPQINIVTATCLNPVHYLLITPENNEILIDVSKKPTDTVASLLFLVKQFRIEGKWPQVIDLRFDKPVLQQIKIVNTELNTDTATESAQEQL